MKTCTGEGAPQKWGREVRTAEIHKCYIIFECHLYVVYMHTHTHIYIYKQYALYIIYTIYVHFCHFCRKPVGFSLGPSVGSCFKLLKPLWTEPNHACTCGCSSRSPKIGILNRSEFFGKARLGCKAPWASKWSSGGIQYNSIKAITNLMGFYCASHKSWNSIDNLLTSALLPVLLLCVFFFRPRV